MLSGLTFSIIIMFEVAANPREEYSALIKPSKVNRFFVPRIVVEVLVSECHKGRFNLNNAEPESIPSLYL